MSILILAPYQLDGQRAADAHNLPHTSIVTPRSTNRVRGQWFDGLLVIGHVRLTHEQAAALAPVFKHRPDLANKIWQLT